MAVNVSTGFASMLLSGSSFASIFQDGCIEFRSGAQPDSADAAPTGTLLGRITRDGGAWTAGNPANGLRWDSAGRYAFKRADHLWNLVGSGPGTLGWFRILGNAADPGTLSSSYPRADGACGVSGAIGDYQFFAPTLAIAPATSFEVNGFYFAIPPLEN